MPTTWSRLGRLVVAMASNTGEASAAFCLPSTFGRGVEMSDGGCNRILSRKAMRVKYAVGRPARRRRFTGDNCRRRCKTHCGGIVSAPDTEMSFADEKGGMKEAVATATWHLPSAAILDAMAFRRVAACCRRAAVSLRLGIVCVRVGVSCRRAVPDQHLLRQACSKSTKHREMKRRAACCFLIWAIRKPT